MKYFSRQRFTIQHNFMHSVEVEITTLLNENFSRHHFEVFLSLISFNHF